MEYQKVDSEAKKLKEQVQAQVDTLQATMNEHSGMSRTPHCNTISQAS